MMPLIEFSNSQQDAAVFKQEKEVKTMDKQELTTQEQNTQITNDTNKGENEMTDQLEQTMDTKHDVNESITQMEVTEEKDIIKDINDAQSEETEQEESVAWNLAMTADSTSLTHITTVIEEDEGDLLGDHDLLEQFESFLDGETKFENDEQKLQAANILLRSFYARHNQAWSGVIGNFAVFAIQQGHLLIVIKNLVKATGRTWEPWAAENLKFMNPRTRQTFMQLAKVSGVDNHAYLGKERLLLMASAVKGMTGDDPIGDLLKNYNLEPNPEDEIDLDAYKDAVDTALDYERLKKASIDVTMESLKKYRADGKKVNNDLITILKAVENSGGDPNLALTGPPDDDDLTIEGQKKAMSFKKIAISLIGTIKWISDHQQYFDKVDVSRINELANSLNELKQMITEANASETQQ